MNKHIGHCYLYSIEIEATGSVEHMTLTYCNLERFIPYLLQSVARSTALVSAGEQLLATAVTNVKFLAKKQKITKCGCIIYGCRTGT
jgi:hypothetical protein